MSERIALVEIDLERCSLTYGSAPCTAAVGVTGAEKCFNCLATCQDKANYAAETVTTTYSYASGDLPRNIDAIPNVKSIDFRPAKLELGESIGIRANVTINFGDSRSPDTGPDGDRYLADRNYDPYTRGTYWGKFRARYPYTKGSNIRILRGTNDQTKAQMETRHFIIDKVAGPTSSGQFTIVCKDALNLLDGKQAQAPVFTKANIQALISNSDTSLTLDPSTAFDDFPDIGLVNIGGNEICEYTKAGSGVLTLVRGRYTTEAVEHKLGERVQWCLKYPYTTLPSDPIPSYEVKSVVGIIRDLLVNYSKVPLDYIPFSDWEIENEYIKRFYSSVIAEPTAAKDLINELLQQTASTLWWDDSAKKLRFRVLRAVSPTAATYNDDLITGGSFSAKDQPEKRVSQVWTYYGQINPLEKLDEKKNYSNSLATIDPESEENYGDASIKSIFSRWIVQDNTSAASRLNDLILSRYSTPPRMLSFGLQRDEYGSLTAPELAGEYYVNNWTLQDATGAAEDVPIQTVQVRASDTGYSVMAEEVLYSETVQPEDPLIIPYPIDTTQADFNLWNAIGDSYPFEAASVLNVTIPETTTIYSTSTLVESFSLGEGWPSGMTINITNNGNIIGKGGAGGIGGNISSNGTLQDGSNGFNGGIAIDVPDSIGVNISIVNNGLIGGGGGGGGGGGAAKGRMATGISSPSQANYGVSGAGGGGATSEGAGKSGGVINNPSLFVTSGTGATINGARIGNTGQAASVYSAGSGGDISGFDFYSGFQPTPEAQVYNGKGGAGGYFGMDGSSGDNGFVAGEVSNSATSSGGAGGLAGNAINKNGNTVTITNNGTIAGNIAT